MRTGIWFVCAERNGTYAEFESVGARSTTRRGGAQIADRNRRSIMCIWSESKHGKRAPGAITSARESQSRERHDPQPCGTEAPSSHPLLAYAGARAAHGS
eukprot:4640296-Prymnesium_polylepis.1